MKKRNKFIIFFFIVIAFDCFSPKVYGDASFEDVLEQVQEHVPNENVSLHELYNQITTGDFHFSFREIVKQVLYGIKDKWMAEKQQIIFLSIIVTLLHILSVVFPQGTKETAVAFRFVAAAAILPTLGSMQILATETIDSLQIFLQSLVPSVVASAVSVSAVPYAGAAGTIYVSMQIFLHIIYSVLIPFSTMIFAIGIADSFMGQRCFSSSLKVITNIFGWVVGLLLTLYGFVMGLETFSADFIHTAGGKAVKYAVGSFVPIVGTAIAESLSVFIAGANVVKITLGIGGIISVCMLLFEPLCKTVLVASVLRLLSFFGGNEQLSFQTILTESAAFARRLALLLVSAGGVFIISIYMLLRLGGAPL